jgi:hypothetical protein
MPRNIIFVLIYHHQEHLDLIEIWGFMKISHHFAGLVKADKNNGHFTSRHISECVRTLNDTCMCTFHFDQDKEEIGHSKKMNVNKVGQESFLCPEVKVMNGCVIAQAVSCWLPTVAARVQTWV